MWTDAELQRQLEAYLADIAGDADWHVHLFQNNHDPAPGDTISAYTEATFAGYAAQIVDPGAFGSVSVVAHVAQSINANENSFTAGSGASAQTIYGYYLTDASNVFVGAENFATPLTVTALGVLKLTPEIKHGILV
jgi:hypothetical protein